MNPGIETYALGFEVRVSTNARLTISEGGAVPQPSDSSGAAGDTDTFLGIRTGSGLDQKTQDDNGPSHCLRSVSNAHFGLHFKVLARQNAAMLREVLIGVNCRDRSPTSLQVQAEYFISREFARLYCVRETDLELGNPLKEMPGFAVRYG